MPKRVPVSKADAEWLKRNPTAHINVIAARLNCCTDTARRILVRLGLRHYPGAKYVAADAPSPTWRKPCLRCGDPEERPRGLFLCSDCRRFADENHAAIA